MATETNASSTCRNVLYFVELTAADVCKLEMHWDELFVRHEGTLYLIDSFAWDQDISIIPNQFREARSIQRTLYPPAGRVIEDAIRMAFAPCYVC